MASWHRAVKRRLGKLVVFLLLGAIINVAVAWGIVLWTPQQPRARGMTVVLNQFDWPRQAPPDWPAPQRQDSDETWGLSHKVTRALVQWLDDPRSHGNIASWGMSIFQAGWPCRCFEADRAWVHDWGVDPQADWRSAVKLPEALHFLGIKEARYRPLPLRPIWPGFAINTIFYAALLWLLTLGPFTARRMIRRKRGHCLKCGYDLRGADHEACPECGVLLPQPPALQGEPTGNR